MSDLPDSWAVLSFGELNEFTSSTVNPVRRSDETFDLYSVPSFPSGFPETLKGSAIGSTKQTVKPDDVLVCKINPRINRVWVVGKKAANEQIASSEWVGFRSQAVVPRYARHYFSSPWFRDLMESDVAGVGGSLTRAQPKKVMTYPVPVAPLAEQTRIANQLDTLLARINACHQRVDTIPALIKRFRQVVLDAATTGRLTEEWRTGVRTSVETWRTVPVGDLISEIHAGLNVTCEERPPLNTEKGLVKISAVTWGRFDESASKTLPASSPVSERVRIQKGDFLISRANTLDLVGACVIVNKIHKNLYLSDKVLRLVVADRLKPWLLICLRSSAGRRQIESLASGNQLSMRNLSQANLKSILIPQPPIEEQTEIVRRVGVLFDLIDQIETRHKTACSQVQRLPSLILSKAFRGELVQQNPDDEPVSDLLARIAAQRKGATPPPKTRQPRAPRVARVPKEFAAMTKSRHDADVKDKPYLAGHLRRLGEPVAAQALYQVAELPLADFYKQLAWEVAQGLVKDNTTTLEPGHAAG